MNFAFIQRNGVPAGPPSPQLSKPATFTPNSQTLTMNPGDVVRTHMWDASIGGGKHAFKVVISDLTTGRGGFMQATAPPNLVTGCLDDVTQNGDLDFDGTPYYADWPTSTVPNKWPSTFLQQQPTTVGGARYSNIQFETDLPARRGVHLRAEHSHGLHGPAQGPGALLPLLHAGEGRRAVRVEFGNMRNGNRFGGDRQYAHLAPHGFFKGQFDFASSPLPNPNC